MVRHHIQPLHSPLRRDKRDPPLGNSKQDGFLTSQLRQHVVPAVLLDGPRNCASPVVPLGSLLLIINAQLPSPTKRGDFQGMQSVPAGCFGAKVARQASTEHSNYCCVTSWPGQMAKQIVTARLFLTHAEDAPSQLATPVGRTCPTAKGAPWHPDCTGLCSPAPSADGAAVQYYGFKVQALSVAPTKTSP